METGLYAQADLSQFVVRAKYQLFGSSDADDNDIYLNLLANEGISALDCLSNFKKGVCTVKIKDKKGKLPNGFTRLIAARYGLSNNWIGNITYVDMPFIKECGTDFINYPYLYNAYPSLEIQNGYIIVHQIPAMTFVNDNNQIEEFEPPLNEITIAYAGLNVDENGLFIGYDDMERAIMHYICYYYCLGHLDIPKFAAACDRHYALWCAQKRFKKGKDFQNKWRETKRQIAEYAHALITDKTNWSTI